MQVLLFLLGGAAIYVALVFYANRRVRPLRGEIAQPTNGPDLPQAGRQLSALTWNIGYAGLGKDADVIIDNGSSLRALSRPDIARAATAIAAWLKPRDVDVICLQENANPGFLTRQVPVRAMVDQALADRLNLFWTDMKSVLVPRFLTIDHGMSVHTRVQLTNCATLDVSQDDTFHFGLLKKHYGGMISRLPLGNTGRDWVVINVHLSAFDVKGKARLRQLETLLDYAQAQFDLGHHVVIGGDWNMRLSDTDFAHRSDIDDLLWAIDFPTEALPKGWQLAVDPQSPSVRALQDRYLAGETYTTILDGFVYAPNVTLAEVNTTDLGFALSDHQPVEATFIADP